MIELQGVSLWYGIVIGLNDVTCTIPSGITALIGQNGAGKSTMMKLVTGQIKPTAGTVLIDGEVPFANPNVFRKLGYCPEIDRFYEDHTGRWFVNHMARLHGFSASEAKRRTTETLEMVAMIDRCDKKIAGYSKGMRQRIKLAQAMLHDPKIILLDEPLNGLDPVGRHEFIGVLGKLAESGKAIIVSSHILHEVEQLTKNILLLHRGRLLATGDLRTIRSLIDKHPHRIQIESSDPRKIAALLALNPDILNLAINREGITIQVKNAEIFYQNFAQLVVEKDLAVTGFTSPDNNLEAVFRYLVGG